MDFEKYTERAKGFVQAAQNLALRENHQKFSTEHVLKVLLDDDQGLASGLIKSAGGDAKAALADTSARLAKFPKVEGSGAGNLYLAPETARLFETAQQISSKAGDSFVTAERLLQALTIEKSGAQDALMGDASLAGDTDFESLATAALRRATAQPEPQAAPADESGSVRVVTAPLPTETSSISAAGRAGYCCRGTNVAAKCHRG